MPPDPTPTPEAAEACAYVYDETESGIPKPCMRVRGHGGKHASYGEAARLDRADFLEAEVARLAAERDECEKQFQAKVAELIVYDEALRNLADYIRTSGFLAVSQSLAISHGVTMKPDEVKECDKVWKMVDSALGPKADNSAK